MWIPKWYPKCANIIGPLRRSWSQVAAGSWFIFFTGSILGSFWDPPGSKIVPKTIPRGPRMAKNVAPNRCSNFDQISAPILTILEPQNGTNIAQKSASEPRARPGPLREACWPHFGFNLGPPEAHVRAFSGCTFASFGWLLVYCWCSFSLASSPPLLAF